MIRYTVQNSHFINIISTRRPCGSIVYIHGLGESGLCFECLVNDRRLSDWNHIVPDLSGYGRSVWPQQGADLDHHVETITDIVNKTVSRPVILIGHSMGGVIGQIICEKYPGLVDGFFNVEGNISLQDCTFSGRAARLSPENFETAGFDDLRKYVYLAGVRDPAFRSYYASLMLAHPATFYRNSRELVVHSRKEDLALRLAHLQIPNRYIAGLKGGAGVRSLELLRQANTDRILMEDSGHWPFIDQTDAFIEHFVRFTYTVGY